MNDLDLEVVDPRATRSCPYVLDKNNPTAAATTGVNTVDNTRDGRDRERHAGHLSPRVTSTSVPQGPQARCSCELRASRAAVRRLCRNRTTAPRPPTATSCRRQSLSGAICTQGDLDFFKFVATKAGTVNVTVTTGDTPIRVTITGTGISRDAGLPGQHDGGGERRANTVPNAITLKFEAVGTIGADPRYTFTPTFGETHAATAEIGAELGRHSGALS